MQQVADWLLNLGLGKYAQSFAENDINFSILPDLTDQDLKELGVASLGHRRQLLRAIAGLKDGESRSSNLTADAVSVAPRDTAERRQVTVMFSDLVGSTAMSARMDPEDLREVISAYQKVVADTVQRFGGFVAKYMGDGVLIYFGYPQAHEDDAERAVRAGLELVAAVRALKSHAPLQTRVGIATGLVVVGDLIGSGASQEQAIVGETPNLAARLQGVAEPNGIVIAESTRKLLGELFELADLGGQDLKGIPGSVRAWGALRPSSIESRFVALRAGGLSELVGREEEVDLLLQRWSWAKSGEGQVVVLSGEPGIGKSRLTAALMERIANEPHTQLRYFCSPQRTDSALYPFIGQIERAAGFAHDDSLQTKLDKLETLLEQSSASPEDTGLFATMLSLSNDGRHPRLELTPQQRRQKTFQALSTQLEALSQPNPVLMIFEDVHWIDPTSLEVLGRAVDRVGTIGVLLVVTCRPEFAPPWTDRPYVTALSVNRLGQREVVRLVDFVTGNKALPASVKQDIIERTDGVPLFVEEMTKAVLEAGNEDAAKRSAAVVPPSSIAVPATLHASLMARLDRLGPAKEIVQIGAVIGREFSHTLLASVSHNSDIELRALLKTIVEGGLFFQHGYPPHSTYLFKHALVQDAAYGTLLRERRRALHARVAETLEKQFAEIAESQPELLARHCTEAGLVEKAAGLWGKAGQRSLDRSALLEAVAQFTRALDQIETLPASPTLRAEQVKIQVAVITPLLHVKGYAAPETKAAVERARVLIEKVKALGEPAEDPLLLFTVLYGLWVGNYVAFNGDMMRDLATQFLALAQKQGATVPIMIGHRILAVSLLFTGDFAAARSHLDRAIALYDPIDHRSLTMHFGQDGRVSSLSFRALPLWLLGYPDAAGADIELAVKEACEIGHAATLMLALGITNYTHLICGNHVATNSFADKLLVLAEEKGASLRKAEAMFQRGGAFALTDRVSDAIDTIAIGITAWRATGATVWTPLHMSFLANAHAKLGHFDEARRCIDEAMTAVETSKEKWCAAEVNRIAGEVALKSPERYAAKAEESFERALVIARAQQAKSWELRASMSLARLWRKQGKVQQARELLAPVYGWFTEGFETRDLKEAKALLEELAA
jgi:class 3 adenylate cyclase/predicted ATPase